MGVYMGENIDGTLENSYPAEKRSQRIIDDNKPAIGSPQRKPKEIEKKENYLIRSIFDISSVNDFIEYLKYLLADDDTVEKNQTEERKKHGAKVADIVYGDDVFFKKNGIKCEKPIPKEDKDRAKDSLKKHGITSKKDFLSKIKDSKGVSRNLLNDSQAINALKRQPIEKTNNMGRGIDNSSGGSGGEKLQVEVKDLQKPKLKPLMTLRNFIANEISENSEVDSTQGFGTNKNKVTLSKKGAEELYDMVKNANDKRAEQLKKIEEKFDQAAKGMERRWDEFDKDNYPSDEKGTQSGNMLLCGGKRHFANMEKLIAENCSEVDEKKQNDIKNFYALVDHEIHRLTLRETVEDFNNGGNKKLSREEEIRQQMEIRQEALSNVKNGRGNKVNETGKILYNKNKTEIEKLEGVVKEKNKAIGNMLEQVDKYRKDMKDVIDGNTNDITEAMISNLKGSSIDIDLGLEKQREEAKRLQNAIIIPKDNKKRIMYLEAKSKIAETLKNKQKRIKQNLQGKVSNEPLGGEKVATGSPRTINESLLSQKYYGQWALSQLIGQQSSKNAGQQLENEKLEPNALRDFIAEKVSEHSKISNWGFNCLSAEGAAKIYEKAKEKNKDKYAENEKKFNGALEDTNKQLEVLKKQKSYGNDTYCMDTTVTLVDEAGIANPTERDSVKDFYSLVQNEIENISKEKSDNSKLSEEDKIKQRMEIRNEAFKRIKEGKNESKSLATAGKSHYLKHRAHIDKIEEKLEEKNEIAKGCLDSIYKNKKIMESVISNNANDITGAMVSHLNETSFVVGPLSEVNRAYYIDTEHKLQESIKSNQSKIKEALKESLKKGQIPGKKSGQGIGNY
jgi:hypothetical protein